MHLQYYPSTIFKLFPGKFGDPATIMQIQK